MGEAQPNHHTRAFIIGPPLPKIMLQLSPINIRGTGSGIPASGPQ
jgi:hypothetical protein